jgi:NAD-dependent deacetylase sirtuin 7
VWTLQKKGQTATMPLAYEETRPTDAHMALRALLRGKRVHHIISQNVDGLHVRSGVPAAQLSELHGNIYHERCPSCAQLFLRHFHVTQSSSYHHHDTERACGAKRCKGACLRDTIVYFGEKLDDATLERARAESEEADVAIFLGTSLRVLQHYKFIWAQQRGRRKQIVIVNLQWTPKDKVADLKINGRCDAVLARLLATLRLKPPPYSLKDDPIARLEKAAGGRPDSGAAAPERGAPKSRAFPTVVRRQPAGDDFVPATGGYKEEACAADEDAQAAAAGDGPEAEASEGATEPTPTKRRRTRA